jgi:uncharacterized protein
VTITVRKPSAADIAAMRDCPTWAKEVSVFDWSYDVSETCYVLAGEVTVTTADGETVSFGAGDLVTFPQGLRCTWDVRAPIRKHYRFG